MLSRRAGCVNTAGPHVGNDCDKTFRIDSTDSAANSRSHVVAMKRSPALNQPHSRSINLASNQRAVNVQ